MKKNKGFTLIELMVVIAIIMILTAIVIPNYVSWKNKRTIEAAKNKAITEEVQPKSNELEKLE